MVELELIDRERRVVERRIKQARFPTLKSPQNQFSLVSGSCDESGSASDGGDEEPCIGRRDGCFPVLGEAAAAAEPGNELGYAPLSPTGAELLFEVFSQRYERGSTIVTSNLPFEDWTSVLGSERLTGALLDRLTHHVHILTMNGDSYRLKQSAGRRAIAICQEL